MHSRKDVDFNDDTVFPADLDVDADSTPTIPEPRANSARRSVSRSCAAKRSIERIREERRLKEQLADTFDDDDSFDYALLDAD